MDEHTAQKWDTRSEADTLAGKLDALGRKADADFLSAKCTPL